MRAGGFPGNPGGLVVSILKTAGGRAPAHQARGRGRSTWRPTERSRRCSDGNRRAKATKRGGMDGEESECLIVCAGQRVAQEGSSPSGALMESTVSKSGGNASLAVACGWRGGGQGVHREVESEGYEEQYRAVIEGAIP